MKNIEELLWNYIDGNCTPEEQKTISELIAQDEVYRLKYEELLNLNNEFAAIELDEPPMAFAYNVIETVRAEHARQPLKAAINNRIILGISLFFIVTIIVLLVYTFSNINLSSAGGLIHLPANVKIPAGGDLMPKPLVHGFLFVDVVLALFLFDTYLRNKKLSKQG